MSRSIFNEFKGLFAGTIDTFATSFSGAVSLIAPGANEHLQIFELRVHGPASLSGITTVQVQDGSGEVVDSVDVQQGDTKVIDFAGFFWRVDTALRFTRPGSDNKAVRVSGVYRTAPN